MSDDTNDLPVFPTNAPAVFCDSDRTAALFGEVLDRLAVSVGGAAAHQDAPTPCAGFTVGALQTHVLGWLEYFAAALLDPEAECARPDPEAFVLGPDRTAVDVVRTAGRDLASTIAANAAGQLITMQSSRMAGDGVLAMALGEYLIHGWDLAVATGTDYSVPEAAVGPAHEFLSDMVAPEYRGPDTGFFDTEVDVGNDATPFEALLGFAGRDPRWQPTT